MAQCIPEDQYKVLQQQIATGEARLTVSRTMARQFFTHVGNQNVADLTGQSIMMKKIVVIFLLLTSILLVFLCMAMMIDRYGWAAMFVIPLVGIFWTILAGLTTELGSTISSTLSLITVLTIAYFLPTTYQWPIVIFAGSVYLFRMAHIFAQYSLSRLILRSYDAYDMLCEHVEIDRDAD